MSIRAIRVSVFDSCVFVFIRGSKTKNPLPPGSGLINFVNESKPDRRAAKKQRPALRDKQQV
jgi:hypothetical protein